MNKRNFTIIGSIAFVCAAFASSAHAQTPSAQPAPATAEPAKTPAPKPASKDASAPEAAAAPAATGTASAAPAQNGAAEDTESTTAVPQESSAPAVVAFDIDDADAALSESLRAALSTAGAKVTAGEQKTPQQQFNSECGKTAACRTTAFSVYPGDAGLFGNVWTDDSLSPPQKALSVVFATEKAVLWEGTFFGKDAAALMAETTFIASRAMSAWSQSVADADAKVALAAAEADKAAKDEAQTPRIDDDEYEDEVAEDGTRIWPEDEAPAEAETADTGKFAQTQPPPDDKVEEGSAVLFWSWIAGFVVIGAAAGACGILFDLFSPTSFNDEIDVGDGVGPALVIAGAAFAVVGVLFNPFSLPEEGAS